MQFNLGTPLYCDKCGGFTTLPKLCSNIACRQPMCGHHTDNKGKCAACHAEAVNPSNKRLWLAQEPCRHCGVLNSTVTRAQHQSNCEQRPHRCPFFVVAHATEEMPVRHARCDFVSRSEVDALPHLQEHHLVEFVQSFYEFADSRAPGDPLELLPLANHLRLCQTDLNSSDAIFIYVFTSGAVYWCNGEAAVYIGAEEKYASHAGGALMLQTATAARMPGVEEKYRVKLNGIHWNSPFRIGWVELEPDQVEAHPMSDLRLPDNLYCTVYRENFTFGKFVSFKLTIQQRSTRHLTASRTGVSSSWAAYGSSGRSSWKNIWRN